MKGRTESKKVCFVVGSRADYSHLRWLMVSVRESLSLSLSVIIIEGNPQVNPSKIAHLLALDGFSADAVVNYSANDDPSLVSNAVSEILIGTTKVFLERDPDIIILLGDRFEIFAAAQAAYFLRIPIGHLHGGEVTAGAIDEAMRHSITKMAHFHWPSAEVYRQRIIRMGEDPLNVHNFGALAVEAVNSIRITPIESLEKELKIPLKRVILVTFHPVTLNPKDSIQNLADLLRVLQKYEEHTIVITYPNMDPGHLEIVHLIRAFEAENPNIFVTPLLGQQNYLRLLLIADLVIGNSSSAFFEAPILGTRAVNIGDRQSGRISCPTTETVNGDLPSISESVERAMGYSRNPTVHHNHPFGSGQTSLQITRMIENLDLTNIRPKIFFDS